MKTTEDVRKEINEATKLQRETTRVVNEALCHAAGKLDKLEEEYNRGLNDCWRMIRRIYLSNKAIEPDRLSVSELDEIFDDVYMGDSYIGGILKNLTPQEALDRINVWEEKKAEEDRKKPEEESKLKIGDVVELCNISGTALKHGIYLETNEYDHVCVAKNDSGLITRMYYRTTCWNIRKTGEHVDILGVLK